MIATLRGEVSQIEDNAIVLEVGGVGLRVFVECSEEWCEKIARYMGELGAGAELPGRRGKSPRARPGG